MRMNDHFSLEMPFSRFARNVAVVSLAALLPLLVLYIASRPGFGALLLSNGPAFKRFLRQVLTNGLPVVFLVNYVGFFLFAWWSARPHGTTNRGALILADMAARLVAFILLHAVIYVVSADWFGSFGGSRATALRVVAPTLARSALFGNISGVYLYATLLSALPIYAAIFGTAREETAPKGRLPATAAPWLAAAALCALFALALSLTAWAIAGVQAE